jgi:hypothetical protein
MTAADASAKFRRMAAELPGAMAAAEARNLKAGLEIAIEQSSGTLSEDDLAAMDHPYARRHATPGADPEVVNVHTDVFREHWETDSKESADGVEGDIFNTADYADEIEDGGRLWIPRPVNAAVARRLQPIRDEELERALNRIISS